MKKLLIFIPICLLCFGCGKSDKDIIINIYENGESKTEEKIITKEYTTTKVEDKKETTKNEDKKVETNDKVETKDDDVETNSNSTSKLTELKDKAKSTYDKAKNWYDENKDELKETNREIIQSDLDTLGGIFNGIRDWYNKKKNN